MLIEQIRADMIEARKADNTVAKSLLVTLFSEAQMVGKNKRNGDTTNDECVSVILKFLTNAHETVRLLQSQGKDAHTYLQEIDILTAYLPTQLDEAALTQAITKIVTDLNLSGVKAMGTIMAELKSRHAGAYDGKLASQIVKSVLS